MIESLALRRRLAVMGPNARVRPTVTPVQRSNGVSPTPNPRAGVEGRDLLLWQGQRLARARRNKHSYWYHGCSLHASAWASIWRSPANVAGDDIKDMFHTFPLAVMQCWSMGLLRLDPYNLTAESLDAALCVCQLGTRWCLASSLSCDFNMIKNCTHVWLLSSLLITPPRCRAPKPLLTVKENLGLRVRWISCVFVLLITAASAPGTASHLGCGTTTAAAR